MPVPKFMKMYPDRTYKSILPGPYKGETYVYNLKYTSQMTGTVVVQIRGNEVDHMNQEQETEGSTMTMTVDVKTIKLCFVKEENRGPCERIRNILVSTAILKTEGSFDNENPVLQNAVVDNAVVENAGQLNTNISNTDLSSKDEGGGSTAVAPTPPAHSSRKKYGLYENVLLSDSEMEKLKKEFPEDYEERIDRLSEYMSSTGKTYRNHLATIRSWARRDKEKIKTSQNTMNRSSQEPTNRQTAAPSAQDDVLWLQQFMKEHGNEFIT